VLAEEDPEAPPPVRMRHVFVGRELGDDAAVGATLRAWGELVESERVEDIASHAAAHLADGAVIGWVQGRSELGPRALGHRSIVADPRPAEHKARINAMIKKREAYRPFAPAVLEERAAEFFELPAARANLSFMLYALPVQPEQRALLGAVTHVDGSARVQTVSRAENERFWRLIEAFGQRTGVPVLLNTSFNNDAEPIVDSPEDAVVCFLTTELEYLAIGDWWVKKRPVDRDAYLGLAPALVRHARAAEAVGFGASMPAHLVSYRTHDPSAEAQLPIFPETYALLRAADGERSLESLLEPLGGPESRAFGELLTLWSRRLVTLTPRGAR
jgi:hypothetical protein